MDSNPYRPSSGCISPPPPPKKEKSNTDICGIELKKKILQIAKEFQEENGITIRDIVFVIEKDMSKLGHTILNVEIDYIS